MLLKRVFFVWALTGLMVSLNEVGAATLLESARKEGAVVFYASVPQEQISRLSEGFEKKYPPIKVQALRAGPSRILSRVMTEERAGNPLVDVINLDTFNAWVLKSKSFLQSYRSDEMEAFPDEFKDAEAMMPCCMYVLTNVMAYNTRSLSQREIPKTYADLLDRRWKGKMGLDNDDAKWFAPLVSIWGKERTVNYFRSLIKQEPSMVRGHALQTELLAAGEFSLAVNLFGYQALELQSRGAPIEIIQADPVIARAGHLLLPKRAPHPNAAKLFIDYVLSAEGQQLLAKMGREVARRGIAIKYPRLLQGVKVQTVKSESLVNFEELSQLYNSIVR